MVCILFIHIFLLNLIFTKILLHCYTQWFLKFLDNLRTFFSLYLDIIYSPQYNIEWKGTNFLQATPITCDAFSTNSSILHQIVYHHVAYEVCSISCKFLFCHRSILLIFLDSLHDFEWVKNIDCKRATLDYHDSTSIS